jgi:hypothetical protein
MSREFSHCAHRVIVLARRTFVANPASAWRDLPVASAATPPRLSFGPGGERMFNRISRSGVAFLSLSGEAGEMSIDFMEPVDKADMNNSRVRRHATKGEGFYHLAVGTDDDASSGARCRTCTPPDPFAYCVRTAGISEQRRHHRPQRSVG